MSGLSPRPRPDTGIRRPRKWTLCAAPLASNSSWLQVAQHPLDRALELAVHKLRLCSLICQLQHVHGALDAGGERSVLIPHDFLQNLYGLLRGHLEPLKGVGVNTQPFTASFREWILSEGE